MDCYQGWKILKQINKGIRVLATSKKMILHAMRGKVHHAVHARLVFSPKNGRYKLDVLMTIIIGMKSKVATSSSPPKDNDEISV